MVVCTVYYAVLCCVGSVRCYDVLYMLSLTNTICGVRTYVTLTSMCDIGSVAVCMRACTVVAYAESERKKERARRGNERTSENQI